MSQVKDHEIAQAVNELRDIAVTFHATQQLRERIAGVVVPLIRRAAPTRLSDEQVAEIGRRTAGLAWCLEFARAIEAAHDIGNRQDMEQPT